MSKQRKFDLEERTARLGESVIDLLRGVRRDDITLPIVNQLVRAATSVGANYAEADDAESRNDFKHKLGICKKEARECTYFLRMLAHALPELRQKVIPIWTEAKELNLIFNAIFKKL